MNIYEDEKLEEKFNEITDQLGYLFLDFVFVTLEKLNKENQTYIDFESARVKTPKTKNHFSTD